MIELQKAIKAARKEDMPGIYKPLERFHKKYADQLHIEREDMLKIRALSQEENEAEKGTLAWNMHKRGYNACVTAFIAKTKRIRIIKDEIFL